MPATKRNVRELFPIGLSFASLFVFLGMDTGELFGWEIRSILALLIATGGIGYGWSFVNANGRNVIVFWGVSFCIAALFIEAGILGFGMLWHL
jgi:hypothetical protein